MNQQRQVNTQKLVIFIVNRFRNREGFLSAQLNRITMITSMRVNHISQSVLLIQRNCMRMSVRERERARKCIRLYGSVVHLCAI